MTYATLHIPPENAFHPYDALQQSAYGAIVFLVAPLMILTGLCMSPAFIARFPWYPKLFGGRQAARSLHFIGLVTLILYVILHVTLVLIVHFFHNIGNMVFGSPYYYPELAAAIAFMGLVAVGLFHVAATIYSRRHQRRFQQVGERVLVPVLRGLLGHLRSRQHHTKTNISPAHRVNGYPPVSREYTQLAEKEFATWRLCIGGLVEHPLELSLDDLRRLPKQEQIVKHNCIQGWSAVAQWAGVPMATILDLCHPAPAARYAAFHAYVQAEYEPDCYYEVVTMEDLRDPQTILAYEMNWQPLPIHHGAPCRLRVETKTGYKMVKYLRAIEFILHQRDVGMGHGGYREDHQYYDSVAAI